MLKFTNFSAPCVFGGRETMLVMFIECSLRIYRAFARMPGLSSTVRRIPALSSISQSFIASFGSHLPAKISASSPIPIMPPNGAYCRGRRRSLCFMRGAPVWRNDFMVLRAWLLKGLKFCIFLSLVLFCLTCKYFC